MIRIIFKEDGTAFCFTPYRKEFVSEMHDIGSAKWDSYEKAWIIQQASIDRVREIMMDIYGETDQETAEMVDLRVTINSELKEWRDSVIKFGKTLARAKGRDSGARVGTDVEFVSGEIGSCGSIKNWYTYVDAGSVFILHNVPKSLYELEKDEYTELIEKNVTNKKAELLAEKEKLEARLTEIEKELVAIK